MGSHSSRAPGDGAMNSARAARLLALGLPLPLLGFIGLMGTAMFLYPGGTWEEPHALGHSLWANYFCDLMRPVALNGTPNETGSALAHWGLLAFSVALLPFFLLLPRCFPDRLRLGMTVRIAGALASAGGVGIVLVPSYKYGALLHGVMVLTAAVPGLTAAIGATAGLWLTERPAGLTRHLAAVTMLLAALAAAIFVRQLMLGTETTFGLAALQKLAVVTAIAWMGLTALHATRRD